MLRLNRYIITEILEVFFAVVMTLIIIMTSFQFAKLLSMAASGKIVGSAIFKLVGLQVLNLFVLLTPFAFFIACLMALSRLASHNELIAMRSVGFGHLSAYRPILYMTLPLSLLILYLTLSLLPETLSIAYKLTNKAKKESELSILQPGTFRTIGDNTTIFVANVDDKNFSKFFVWQNINDSDNITIAKEGTQFEKNNERYIELLNGSRLTEKKDTTQLGTFSHLTILLPSIEEDEKKQKVKATPTEELLESQNIEDRIELQKRVSPAISIILLSFFAPILVQFNPRENRYGNFVIAILVYLLYTNSQYILQALIEDNKLSLFPGIYLSHGIFLSFTIIWIMFLRRK